MQTYTGPPQYIETSIIALYRITIYIESWKLSPNYENWDFKCQEMLSQQRKCCFPCRYNFVGIIF